MNEETIMYRDDLMEQFTKEESFLSFLKKIGKNSTWGVNSVKNMRMYALEEGTKVTETMKAGIPQDILEDTLKNTGLALKVNGAVLPVRNCAIKTILERAGISGPALNKVEKGVYAKILNFCLRKSNSDALIRISADKVSAVLSKEYCILDVEQIFAHTIDFLYSNFTNSEYLGGFYEHNMASALWEIKDDLLLSAYKKEIDEKGITFEMKPMLRVKTSDTGNSGANIYPLMYDGIRIYPLGSPIKLNHKSGVTIEDFDNHLQLIFGKYNQAVKGLIKLMSIEIENPINCMLRVMKKVGITKKYAYEASETYKAKCGEDVCTAHDLYYGIGEVLFLATVAGESGARLTDLEETIARTLAIGWHEYDIPGDFKW